MNLMNDNAAQVAAHIFALRSAELPWKGKQRKASLERIAKEALADADVFVKVWERVRGESK